MAPIIDSHQHFWNIERFKYPWMLPALTVLRRNYLPDDLRPHMEQTGVERTVAIQAQAEHALEETCWLLELAESEDFVAAVVGWINPADPNVERFLEMIAMRPLLRGVRHLAPKKADVDWQVREDVLRGLSAVAKHGLTYDLLLRPPQIVYVPVLAKRLPELKIVIDHVAKPPIKKGLMDGWLHGMEAAAAFPNVYCKLSGLITEADWKNWKPQDLKPYVEKVVERFGSERLMFGSDWPICLLAGSYERVYEALVTALGQLSDGERENIFGKTASSFYGIDVSDAEATPDLDHESQLEHTG